MKHIIILLFVLLYNSAAFPQDANTEFLQNGFYIPVKKILIDNLVFDKIEISANEITDKSSNSADPGEPQVNVRLSSSNPQFYLTFKAKQVRVSKDSLCFKLFFPDAAELTFNGFLINNRNRFGNNNINPAKTALIGKIIVKQNNKELLNGIYDFTLLSTELTTQKTGSTTKLEGTVISRINNKPIGYCSVEIANPKMSATTDYSGKFSFNNLIAGNTYVLTIKAGFYPYKDTAVYLQKRERNNVLLYLTAECDYDSIRAVKDIAAGNIRFLYTEGVMKSPNTPADDKFENIYKIKYYNLGSEHNSYECISQYNKAVAGYLDKKYGKDWRQTVRNNIIYK